MSDFVLIVVPAVLLGLSIVAVLKDFAAKVLFWIYLYIVLSLIGYSLSCSINHDVFYLTRDDFEKIIASLIVLVIPVILQLKIEYKRLIRGVLYAIQFFICIILSLWIYISTDCDEPRPLSRTDIEKMVLVKIPDYRIIEFDVFYNIDQTLKFKGDRTRFYESLDSVSKVDGLKMPVCMCLIVFGWMMNIRVKLYHHIAFIQCMYMIIMKQKYMLIE